MSTGSRYRAIHCLIWNDDKFPFMSDHGKLVFFHLLTTPFSTPFGCFKAGKASLLEESRIDPKGFAKGFAEGLEKGMFKYDERTLTIFLPNFLKHNKPPNPNVVKKWSKVFREIPDGPLRDENYFAISECCERTGKAFAKAFRESFPEPPGKSMAIQEQEQEQEQEQDKDSCPELSGERSEPEQEQKKAVLFFPIVGDPGNENQFPIFQEDVDQWQECFPGLKVSMELPKIRQWSVDNPKKRKTKTGIRNHIRGWLDREQNTRGGNNGTGGSSSENFEGIDYQAGATPIGDIHFIDKKPDFP